MRRDHPAYAYKNQQIKQDQQGVNEIEGQTTNDTGFYMGRKVPPQTDPNLPKQLGILAQYSGRLPSPNQFTY